MIIRLMLAVFITTFAILSADVEDFFKSAPNKSNKNRIKGIDFIYMINLDERPEKFKLSADQLATFKIYPYRFSAVNGWKIPIESINTLGVVFEPNMQSVKGTMYLPEDGGEARHEVVAMEPGRNYFCHCMTRGAIGIVLSHLSVLQDAYDSGYETIWVMEDDIDVIRDPNTLYRYIKELDSLVGKKNWDILFTDPDTKDQKGNYVMCLSYALRPNFSPKNPKRFAARKGISRNLTKNGARYGAYSMIVRRSGMKKILDFVKKYQIFLPYAMDFCMPNDINMYSLTFDLVSTLPKALSDNGAANYKLNNTGILDMDADINLNQGFETLAATHYEWVKNNSELEDLTALKTKVSSSMSELEGWCSDEKAFVLVDMIVATKPEVIVEIGVFGGKSLVPMAYALKYNKKGKIFGIDPWSADASSEGMDGANLNWWSSIDHAKILAGLNKKIAKFHLQSETVLVQSTSEDCEPIENIDLLHIDGNHSEKASYLDVIKWVPLVKSGGFIIFDDVNWSTTKLATEWLDTHCIKVTEYKGDNIWGIWIKP